MLLKEFPCDMRLDCNFSVYIHVLLSANVAVFVINIWRDSVTYDELTINECQKSDAEFADILDRVRRGCPTDKTNATIPF